MWEASRALKNGDVQVDFMCTVDLEVTMWGVVPVQGVKVTHNRQVIVPAVSTWKKSLTSRWRKHLGRIGRELLKLLDPEWADGSNGLFGGDGSGGDDDAFLEDLREVSAHRKQLATSLS